MKIKIKHAIAYIILIACICGIFIGLWDWIVEPLIELGITLGLVKSLICLCLVIGLGMFLGFIGWAGEKLIDWLLEEQRWRNETDDKQHMEYVSISAEHEFDHHMWCPCCNSAGIPSLGK